jgi:hypothetical protein
VTPPTVKRCCEKAVLDTNEGGTGRSTRAAHPKQREWNDFCRLVYSEAAAVQTVTHLKAHRFFVLPDAQNEIQARWKEEETWRKNQVSLLSNFEEVENKFTSITEDPEAPLGFDQFNVRVRGPWHSCVKWPRRAVPVSGDKSISMSKQ